MSTEVQVGTILRETYEITAPLGSGGMGTVYVARHLRLPGKQVAVKVLHGSSGIGSEILSRFRREAEIASRLGHPNIVQVFDFDTLPGGTPFLVMELLRGESLAQRLSTGPLSWQKTQALARQVGSALRAAHRAGVVHRDLKPDNIFLVPNETGGVVSEQVKLLDFGISKISSEPSTLKTRDHILMGTPLYMSPEQALGKNSEVDARTDIFAFGSILYEMLCGRPPFIGDNIPQIVYRIAQEKPEPLSTLCPLAPPRAVAAIERALAKKPEDRFPDIESFVAELTGSPLQALPNFALAPGQLNNDNPSTVLWKPEQSPSPASSPRAERTLLDRPPRRLTPWLIAAVMALIGVLGGVGLVWRANRLERSSVQPPTVVSPPVQDAGGPTSPEGAATATTSAPPPVEKAPASSAPPPPSVQPATPDVAVPKTNTISRPVARPMRPLSPSSPVSVKQAREARDLLASAHKALSAENGKLAIDLARRVERIDPGLSTHAVLTMGYCLLGDLGNARPEYDLVPLAHRRSVKLFCKQHGVELIER